MPPESRTGRRHALRHPGRLVAEALGQDDEIDDLGRVRVTPGFSDAERVAILGETAEKLLAIKPA
jgi:hypothetical protein